LDWAGAGVGKREGSDKKSRAHGGDCFGYHFMLPNITLAELLRNSGLLS
jgi:hypothetical protein